MRKQIHIPHDLCNEALQVAVHDGFPEVIRILKSFQNGVAELNSREASHLLDFARFLQQRARLHYPYWDDSESPHDPEHEDNFHEVNMGLHEKLVFYIGSEFPDLIGS